MLKVGAAVAGGAMLSSTRLSARNEKRAPNAKPNIIILLFDAMSARHLSTYGYARGTTPNLERFAARANVYHSHSSAGSFTSSGTASMLTGLFPWNHRALSQSAPVKRELADANIFSMLGPEYYRLGYTQNPWAQLFLGQFRAHLEEILPLSSFSFRQVASTGARFVNDPTTAYYAYDDLLVSGHQAQGQKPASLATFLYDKLIHHKLESFESAQYPIGFPDNNFYQYQLDETFSGIQKTISTLSQQSKPFFAYFHIWAPHEPFAPLREFFHQFDAQDPQVPARPQHPLAMSTFSEKDLRRERNRYDSYIASVDYEFGSLLSALEAGGRLDNAHLILTSDHGHLFERGVLGHVTPLLCDPVIHIPLMISSPGQTARKDIYTPTSNADILPTVLHLAGQPALSAGLDGVALPLLGGEADSARPIISLDAKKNSAFLPLKRVSISMRKGDWKLIRYAGYPAASESYELYNIVQDSFEQQNQFQKAASIASAMQAEMLDMLAQADKPFQKATP